jgi:hypothetical protein
LAFTSIPPLCRAVGRPAHALSGELKRRLAAAGSKAPACGVERKERFLFQYDCGCWGFKQLRSLRRRKEAALACPEHDRPRGPTQLLLQVRCSMQQAVPDLGPIVLEACLLPKYSKPLDMWLPKWGIAVEVDGRQHFRGSMHGTAAQRQYRRDREVDAACRKHRLRLVRCHYQDDRQWGSLLQQAVKAVKANPLCSFVFYTRSYTFEAGAHAPPTL